MKSQTLVAALLLGLAVVVQSSPAKLDQVYEQRESKSNLNDDDKRRPYSFAYEASRHYHGAPDREHREERGEDGITRGVYRYVDPSLRVQEVIYTADENGFHVESNNDPEYTEAQIVARERHAQLFQEIADEHNRIGNEHAQKAAERGYDPQQETYVAPQSHLDYSTGTLDPALLPQNSPAVERARTQHQELFAKIAEQHARIAAERKTDPRAEETGEPYEYQYDTPLKTVEVVSGSVGPSVLSRSASVVAPGEGHADFQGYGVPLGTFRDDLTEEEALALLEEENQRHLMQFMNEADNHERLVLAFMPPGSTGANQGRVGFPGGNQGQFAATHTAQQGGNRQGGGFSAGASGNRQQTAGSAGSSLHSSGGAGKVQTSFSHKTPNAHSNTQGQSRFSIGVVDPLRSDSHNQRAIGGAGIKFNNQEQSSLNDPESISYSAGGAGSQGIGGQVGGSQALGSAGGRTQLSSAATGSGQANFNAYSSGHGSSVAQASGPKGVGGSGSQGQFSAKPQGSFGSNQGQYSVGNQAGGNAAQFAGGNKHNQHGSTSLSAGAIGQASGGQYTNGNKNQGSFGQVSSSSGNTQGKKQGQHNPAGSHTQQGQATFSGQAQQQGKKPGQYNAAGGPTQQGQATFSGQAQQQGKKQGQYNAAGGHTQQGQAKFSGQAQQQGNKQGQYNAAGGHTQQGQATFSGQAQQQGNKQGQYNAAGGHTQQGQATFSGQAQQQGNKQGQYNAAGGHTQQGQATFSGQSQQHGNKQGQYNAAGTQTQQGGQASFSVENQPQGKKQGQFNAAGGHTHQGGHAAYSGGNQQHGTKQGPHGFAVAQTQDGVQAAFSTGNQQRQNKQGHSSGAGGAGLSAASNGLYQASQHGQQGGESHSLSSSGSTGHFQGSQRQQQGAGLQNLADGVFGHSADHEQARALLEEQRQNHLRQFRKIAQAHEQIGDEHHQLTLATLQKHKMKIQNW